MKHALGLIETVGMAAAVEAADTALKSANISLIGMELTKGDGMVVVKIEGDVGAVQAAVESARQAAALVNRVYSTKVIPRPSEGIEKIVFSKETKGIEKAEDEVKIDSKLEEPVVPVAEETVETVEADMVELTIETKENNEVKAVVEAEGIIDTAQASETLEGKAEEVVMEAVEEIIKIVEENREAEITEEVVEALKENIETQEIGEAEENEEVLDSEEPEALKTATCNLCHDPDCLRKKGESKDRCIHHKINKEA